MSPSNGNAPTSTIPRVTGSVTKVASVTITLVRSGTTISKTLVPPADTPVQMSFIHQDGGMPKHDRPHGIVWEVRGLLQGERMEIQLDTCFPGFATKPTSVHQVPWWDHLRDLFPKAGVLKSGAFGFHLDYNDPFALSGHAVLKERFELKKSGSKSLPVIGYKIVFYDVSGQPQELDPQVEVTPDP